MLTAILHGCNGRMGWTIAKLLDEDRELRIVAGIDVHDTKEHDFPVYTNIAACIERADVVIDCSIAPAIAALLDYCVTQRTPCVVCTTGLSTADEAKLIEAAEHTAILRSANMSLGINILLKMVKDATKVLAPADFDIEIIEKHHNQKIDAPSGTALALADAINGELAGEYTYNYDRSTTRTKREQKEIGIAAVRGGTIAGEHDIIFAGLDEVITFSHAAYSRSIFGRGAITAAKYLAGKPAGLYTMGDVIG